MTPTDRAAKRPVIVTEGLRKRYGEVEALRGLDLTVEQGNVVGLLGPNGAGKTTTVRILATLLRLDAGRAEVAGYDVVRQRREVRARIALTGQYAAVDEFLTGRENLEMVGRLSGLRRAAAKRRADELLQRLDLVDAASRPVKTYSGGMRRRLDLAASLVLSPPVLFLDEPTTGLDPRSRSTIWELIADLVAAGASVLLTSQYLEEVDRLADRIVVIDDGEVVAQGSSRELKAKVGGERVEVVVSSQSDFEAAVGVLRARADVDHVSREQRRVVLRAGGARLVGQVARHLEDAGVDVDDLSLRRPTLDDVFLMLTGRSVKEPTVEDPVNGARHPDAAKQEERAAL